MRCWWLLVFAVGCLVPMTALAQPTAEPADEAATTEGEPQAAVEASSEPTPEQKQEASDRFNRGLKFYREAEYELALIEFDRAYATIPDYRVLFNIGQVCVELGRYARARVAFQKYLEEGGDAIDADRAEKVRADLDMLSSRTAFLVLTTNVEGASVLIDGNVVGQTPLADELILDAGIHQIEVRHPAYSSVPRRVTLAGGDRQELTMELTPLVREEPRSNPPSTVEPPPARPLAPPPTDSGVEERKSTLLWVGWATTATLAVGAGTTFALASSAATQHEEMKKEVVQPGDLEAQANKANGLLLATDILDASAVVAGGVSLYLTLHHREHRKKKAGARLAPRAWVRAGPTQVTLTGTF